MAFSEPRRAGEVLREVPNGAAETFADVPTLERPGQLPIRHQEEETEEGPDRRPR